MREEWCGNIEWMSRQVDELAREVESLHGELEEARAGALGLESALTELDERRTETENRLELARQQIADLGRRVELRQAELEEARQQAIYDAFVAVVAERDEAAEEAAAHIEAALDALGTLEQRRDDVADALKGVPSRFGAAVPDEPGELAEAWARVVASVRADLDHKLEDELVHTAATSTNARAIQDLPVHLREAATRRRREIQKRTRHALRNPQPS